MSFHKINLDAIKLSQVCIIQIYSPDWENKAHTGKEMVSYKITWVTSFSNAVNVKMYWLQKQDSLLWGNVMFLHDISVIFLEAFAIICEDTFAADKYVTQLWTFKPVQKFTWEIVQQLPCYFGISFHRITESQNS